jgi:hypothetical protein
MAKLEPVVTRLIGRAEYDDGHGGKVTADACTLYDHGTEGTTRVFCVYPDITPEENKRRVARLKADTRAIWLRCAKDGA